MLFTLSAESAFAAKDPKVTLTFGGTFAADDLATQAMERIAENVKEQSNGSIIINVFPASQLGDAVAQIESMIAGAEDMVIEAQGSYMQQYGVKGAAVNSFGLVYSQEKLAKELESDFWAGLEKEFLDSTGIYTLANNFIRQPTVIASKTPLRTIDDFKGVSSARFPLRSLWMFTTHLVSPPLQSLSTKFTFLSSRALSTLPLQALTSSTPWASMTTRLT